MYLVRPPVLLKLLYQEALWTISTKEPHLYLTFDDGPIPEVTPWVLEQLKDFNAKATFFCIGQNIQKNPEIFEEIKTQGHSIGNHTYTHVNGWQTSANDYLKNVEKCQELTRSDLFRPPYGRMKPTQYAELSKKYKIVMWDVLSGDFDIKVSRKKCFENVMKFTRPGSIIVFHDSLKAESRLSYALPKTLEHFQKEGYSFKSL